MKIKDLIEYGSDIEFSYHGEKYTILPWTDDGIVIGKQGDDDNDQSYKSYDDMINTYEMAGRKMKDVLTDIKITFNS